MWPSSVSVPLPRCLRLTPASDLLGSLSENSLIVDTADVAMV